MIKEYRNWANQKVTPQQIANMDSYDEVFIDPSTQLIKRVNKYDLGLLRRINYFIDSSENETDIFNQLKNQIDLFDIREREIIGGYVVVITKGYSLSVGNIPLIGKFVYELNETDPTLFICSQRIDNNTMLPILEETTKYYHTFDETGAIEGGEIYDLMEACYNEDGSLDYITFKPEGDDNSGQDWEYFDASNFADLQTYFVEDISYYLTADLLPKSNL